MWSLDTESNDVVQATSELYLKSLAGGNAAYAGGSLQGKPRKVAIIAPSDPWYQSAAQSAVQQAAAAGHPISDNIQYQLNLSTLSSQASNVISQLQNDGITTVICGCDPVFPVYLTSRAAEQGYTPEWVVAGVALTDQDIVGQLFAQSEWSHAFGVTFNGPHGAQAEHVRLFGLQADQLGHGAGQRGRPHLRADVRDGHRHRDGGTRPDPGDVPERHAGLSGQPGRRGQCALRHLVVPGRPLHTADATGPSSTGIPTKTSPYDDKAGAYVASSTRTKIGSYAGGALRRALQLPDRSGGRGLAGPWRSPSPSRSVAPGRPRPPACAASV